MPENNIIIDIPPIHSFHFILWEFAKFQLKKSTQNPLHKFSCVPVIETSESSSNIILFSQSDLFRYVYTYLGPHALPISLKIS